MTGSPRLVARDVNRLRISRTIGVHVHRRAVGRDNHLPKLRLFVFAARSVDYLRSRKRRRDAVHVRGRDVDRHGLLPRHRDHVAPLDGFARHGADTRHRLALHGSLSWGGATCTGPPRRRSTRRMTPEVGYKRLASLTLSLLIVLTPLVAHQISGFDAAAGRAEANSVVEPRILCGVFRTLIRRVLSRLALQRATVS